LALASNIPKEDHVMISPVRIVKIIVMSFVAVAGSLSGQLAAQLPAIGLTKIGSPIWKPVDFQLFSAPGDTDAAFNATLDSLSPRDPRGVTTYTTPHAPPYDTELSESAAAVGLVSHSVFPSKAISNDPNNVYFALTLLPDPGVTGSSRDFASGPVIPNSLFPVTGQGTLWINGAFAFDIGGGQISLRPTDMPFEGTSHRTIFTSVWNNGPNNLGSYELRSSLRDSHGNGWDLVAPFRIVDELPAGDFNQDGTVDAADYVVWRKTDGTQEGYDAWRANFGQTVVAGGSPALMTTGEPPVTAPAVPEPATLMIACVAASGIGAARRRTRQGRLSCIG
jgi:hypothetical protein